MGEIQRHRPVMLIMAVVSQFDEAFAWSTQIARQQWGEIALTSPKFQFTETEFYQQSMGTSLMKQFLAFETLIDPAKIADTKLASNQWEEEFAKQSTHAVERPVNLDPGYLTEAKLVLATTKDRDHRLYLRDGIFAEVTLHFHHRQWRASRWTYPDYQRTDFQAFFSDCRKLLREKYRTSD